MSPHYEAIWGMGVEAAEQRVQDLENTETDIESEIADTPAETLVGVLIKLRLADYWIRAQHSNSKETLVEAALRTAECLALSALVDLDRLAEEARS